MYNVQAFPDNIRKACVIIIAAILFTTIVLLISGADPLAAYFHIIKGSLGSWRKFAQVLQVWIPMTLCSCGLLYTFKMNLWNIGIEGQMIMGAVCATAILRIEIAPHFPFLFLTASLMAGVLGGALWALIAGFLKTKGGVNEIFAGLGLNFVAQGVILWLIFGQWRRPGSASMSGTEVFPRELWLPYIQELRISPPGLFLAVAAIFVTGFMLNSARIGLHFRAMGENSAAAFLFGLKPSRLMIAAMLFAGGFAGLAGSIQTTGVYHRLIPAISSNYGYLALLIVMLSNYQIRMVPVAAFFFACLNVGSIQLPMIMKIDSSLSGVIQGSFVLSAIAAQAWQSLKKNRRIE